MEELKDLLRQMSLEYFASGVHRCDIEEFKKSLLEGEDITIIDVRTKEEHKIINFSFMENIPLHELPDRYKEIPVDKKVLLFCSCKVRILIAYVFLKVMGFDKVKILDADIETLSGILKPHLVLKAKEIIKFET